MTAKDRMHGAPTWMHEEIEEIRDSFGVWWPIRLTSCRASSRAFRAERPRLAIIAGHGTSDHTAFEATAA